MSTLTQQDGKTLQTKTSVDSIRTNRRLTMVVQDLERLQAQLMLQADLSTNIVAQLEVFLQELPLEQESKS